jgi:hypothetical protein
MTLEHNIHQSNAQPSRSGVLDAGVRPHPCPNRQAFPFGDPAVMDQTTRRFDHLNFKTSSEPQSWHLQRIFDRWVPVCQQIVMRLALPVPDGDRLQQIIIAGYNAMWLMIENSTEFPRLETQYRFVLLFLFLCLTHCD